LGGADVTLFEYIAIAFSLVQSFTVLRALSGIPHAIQRARRYWVHMTWLGSTLATVLFTFWTFWWNRDAEWNFVLFALALVPPSVLYVFVSLLVPQDPAAVASWREHFFAVRFRLFVTAIVWDITFFWAALVRSDEFSTPGAFALLVVHFLGAISARPVLHAVLVLVPPTLIAILGLTMFLRPPALP
jgi:hypothetical protein